MRNVSSTDFNAAVEKEFAFLLENGFSIPADGRTDTSLTAGVLFVGRNVAVDLGLDRRDECIDCYISRVRDGKVIENNVSGGYRGSFHAFLVKYRHFRGSFKEFRPEDQSIEPFVRELKEYANALKTHAPDIVSDSENVFETKT